MSQPTFAMRFQRLHRKDNLVSGSLFVNDERIGTTYENDKLKVAAGTYIGILRYDSRKNHVQGPFGLVSKQGDFLIELVGTKKTHIQFHGGNKPKHSDGCILLGPVAKDPATGTGFVDSDSTLHKLRLKFYGTELPNQCPFYQISIQILDAPK